MQPYLPISSQSSQFTQNFHPHTNDQTLTPVPKSEYESEEYFAFESSKPTQDNNSLDHWKQESTGQEAFSPSQKTTRQAYLRVLQKLEQTHLNSNQSHENQMILQSPALKLEPSEPSYLPKTSDSLQINQTPIASAEENLEDLLNEAPDNFIKDYKWDPSHDDLLLELAYTLKFDWQRVARAFPEKKVPVKAFKERYRKLHSVTLGNKARFSNEEDNKILKYYHMYGTKWTAMANMLPGRTALAIKNRFYSSLRTQLKKSCSHQSPPASSTLNSTPLTFPNLAQVRSKSFTTETSAFELKEADLSSTVISNSNRPIDTHTLQCFDCDSFFDFQSTQYPPEEAKTTFEGFEDPMEVESSFIENKDGGHDLQKRTSLGPQEKPAKPEFTQKPTRRKAKTEPQKIIEEAPSEKDQQTSSSPKRTSELSKNLVNEIDGLLMMSYLERENFRERIKKDPDLMVKELNERVSSVMTLCQEVQAELGKISKKIVKTDE